MVQEARNSFSLCKTYKRTWQRLLSIAFIMGLLFMCRYQPGLSAAPGLEEIWVTETHLPAGYLKTVQTILEYQPCTYELLGWKGDSLFYQSQCRENIRFWQYTANQSNHAEEITAVPLNLIQTTVSHDDALQMVRADGVRPVDKEFVTRRVLLEGDGLASPNGLWTAVIVQHLYAPQDILLLTRK
jgi:hypothetical protein